MRKSISISRLIASLVLLVVFLMPSVAEFSHIFDADEHVVCHEKTEHMHEMSLDCAVCHFQLASFPYEIADYPEFNFAVLPSTVEKEYTFLFEPSFQKTANSLRGPPPFFG